MRRLKEVQDAIAQTNEERDNLRATLDIQKTRVKKIAEKRAQIDDAKKQIQINEARSNEGKPEVTTKLAELYGMVRCFEAEYAVLVKETYSDVSNLYVEIVDTEQIAEIVSRWTGIPVNRLTQSEKDKILGLMDRLKAMVVGQDRPVEAIANAILRSRAGLGNADRPTGCFLMLGPSGVGKTHLI